MLEGLDGVGKTTQVALLSSWLDAQGASHIVVREPGGTPIGEAIRELVLGRTDLSVPPESELFLLLAARGALVREVIRPALERDETVVADRFALSTLAYQAYGRGIDVEGVRAAIDLATGGLRPDLCIVLDLPEEESLERQERGGGGADRIEREGRAFRHTVRDAYLALADSEPGVEVVSAQGMPEEVHARIRDVLAARVAGALGSLAADVGGGGGNGS